jgi:hypothetical protein
VVSVPRETVRPKSDDDRWLYLFDDPNQPSNDLVVVLHGSERAILLAQQKRFFNSIRFARAARLSFASGTELWPGGNVGVWRNPMLPGCNNGKVSVDALPCIMGQ